MNYTQYKTQDLWDLITHCGSKPTIKDVTASLSAHLQVKNNAKLKAIVTKELRKHKKAADKMKSTWSGNRTTPQAQENEALFDDGDLDNDVFMEFDPTEQGPSSSYKLRRSFGSLGSKQ